MDLISKKDLLAQTGISYGQLYRWKRERLIPEDWFIKQSSYTGQETYFPRAQMLERVQAILSSKDAYSLEQLATMFSPESAADSAVPAAALSQIRELHPELLKLLPQGQDRYPFWDVVLLAMLSRVYTAFSLSEAQAVDLLQKAASVSGLLTSTETNCTVFVSGDTYHLAFARDVRPILFDGSIQARAIYPLSEIANELKLKYGTNFIKL